MRSTIQKTISSSKAFRKCLVLLNRVYLKISESNNDNARLLLKVKSKAKTIAAGRYIFVSMADLFIWSCEWVKQFPERYDIVVGVPRSGLMVANIVAAKLGKPLATPEMILEKKVWISSHGMKVASFHHILLVEDSTAHGLTLENTKRRINEVFPTARITSASLLVTDESYQKVDLFYKRLNGRIAFEWLIIFCKPARVVAVDIDGVLCQECPDGFDDDESLYQQWLANACPYLIPDYKIDFIVTNRLEKYRHLTEEWLHKQGVEYDTLMMWDLPDKKQRDGMFAEHKVQMMTEAKPDILLESSRQEGMEVWKRTGIPVICFDEMIMFS